MTGWKIWLYGSLLGTVFGILLMLLTEISVSMIGIVVGSGLSALFISRKG